MSRDTSLVIHVSEMDKYPDAVYIGRAMPRRNLKASPYANPFKIGADAPKWFGESDLLQSPMGRDAVLFGFATWFLADADRVESLIPLRGKHLACWCRRSDEPFCNSGEGDNRCHGDCLTHWLHVWDDETIRTMAAEIRAT